MKKTTAFLLTAFCFWGAFVQAQEDRVKGKDKPGRKPASAPAVRTAPRAGTNRPVRVRQPVTIKMSRPSPNAQNHPSQQPSYGRIQPNRRAQQPPAAVQAPAFQTQALRRQGNVPTPKARSAKAVHHHVYTQGYVRKKLSKIGVKTEPLYITDRSEIVSSDRAHSIVRIPRTGPKGEAFKGALVSPRKFNIDLVRRQMAIANHPAFLQQIEKENRNENERNRMYWHGGAGFDYAYTHYIDDSGFHWYGWYRGDQFFWTRNYNGRWWWYDEGFNRWCFYNDDYWWWQDPYHVGELYVYNDDGYIPANSANDPVVVSGADEANDAVYDSPDGTRRVKLAPTGGDAFLYDRADPPAFDPIYLASGVQTIQFSSPGSGRPLEIILKLSDGSFDMFDGEGRPFNSDMSDGNQ